MTTSFKSAFFFFSLAYVTKTLPDLVSFYHIPCNYVFLQLFLLWLERALFQLLLMNFIFHLLQLLFCLFVLFQQTLYYFACTFEMIDIWFVQKNVALNVLFLGSLLNCSYDRITFEIRGVYLFWLCLCTVYYFSFQRFRTFSYCTCVIERYSFV